MAKKARGGPREQSRGTIAKAEGEIVADEMVRDALVSLHVPVPMRDGTRLRANVFRPAGDGPFPVLLTRTPYGKDFATGMLGVEPLRAVERGYIVVVQDVRGRYRSEGEWLPFLHEFEDGYDSVAWAAGLPGSDGRVAMFGGSYFGMTQWQAAVGQPPGLAAMAPSITWGNYLNGSVYRGGARELGLSLYWYLGALAPGDVLRRYEGRPLELLTKLPALIGAIDHLPALYATLPPGDVPDAEGLLASLRRFAAWAPDDPAWRDLNLDDRYDKVQVPTFHTAGWYDIFLGETLRQYGAMLRLAEERGTQKPRLMIGPWTHGNFVSFSGDVEFGMASSGMLLGYQGDMTEVHLRFFDRALGRPVPFPEMPSVEVFVMGENRWRYFPAWPVAEAQEERWYLTSGGNANTAAGDGRLERSPSRDARPDSYVYDPLEPVPTIGGSLLMPASYRAGPRDQGPNEARRDVLCYTSEPFAEPYTVIGPVSATLHVASSAPDTDFVARLVDVHPDGRAINLTDGIVRARWRHTYSVPGEIRPQAPEPLRPDEVAAVTIDLWATGVTFLPGHRLRLEVTSSSFPRWDRNLNTGTDEFLEPRTPRKAEQTVFHDQEHPSFVTLPHVAG